MNSYRVYLRSPNGVITFAEYADIGGANGHRDAINSAHGHVVALVLEAGEPKPAGIDFERAQDWEVACNRVATVANSALRDFMRRPSATNYMKATNWMLSHQRMSANNLPARHRESLVLDLARTLPADWTACIAAVPDL